MSGQNVRRHAIVTGRVQGVGFRDFTRSEARGLGLSGYVRNLSNGNVELEAEGPREEVERLLAAVKRGPTMGHVDDVQVTDRPAKNESGSFEIRF